MDRNTFKRLSRLRIREAKILFNEGEYSGAYYLAGYAAEFAIKACIAEKIKRYTFPDKKFFNSIFTHDIEDLIKIAGFEIDKKNLVTNDINFRSYWPVVIAWSEQTRYKMISKTDAKDLIKALTSRTGGILPWLWSKW